MGRGGRRGDEWWMGTSDGRTKLGGLKRGEDEEADGERVSGGDGEECVWRDS